jgi:signal peptidase I
MNRTRFATQRKALLLIGPTVVVLLSGCQEVGSLLLGKRAYTLSSSSMEKTIYAGETILCDTRAYSSQAPLRGDVVVFKHGEFTLVKRLIGLPGDHVEGKDGVVSVNGSALIEPYVARIGDAYAETFDSKVVAPGTVFLLGDNRNHSLDSRMTEFGEVRLDDIQCKAASIIKSDHGGSGQTIQ